MKVLAVASAGGHWTQLLRLRAAFQGHEVVYVSTARQTVPGARTFCVKDANRDEKLSMIKLLAQTLWIVLRERPRVVISTGAAPGYVAIRLARCFGASTIWVDSFANVDELSMSGAMVGPYADLWLTQWAHLKKASGPEYAGAVL